MSLHLSACTACGAAYFPPRLRCRHCGGHAFELQPCADGAVEGITRVHRIPEGCDFSFLVELRTGAGVAIVAGAAHPVAVGERVPLARRDDGAVFVVQD